MRIGSSKPRTPLKQTVVNIASQAIREGNATQEYGAPIDSLAKNKSIQD